MPKPTRELSQRDANRLCEAASAAYFSILHAHANRTGVPPLIPELLCPRDGLVPCIGRFSDDELDEAEQFLVRLGLIAER